MEGEESFFIKAIVEKNKKNYSKAFEILNNIKEYPKAKLELAYLFINGLGVQKDFEKSINYLNEIAKHEEMRAELIAFLSECYIENEELIDEKKAYECIAMSEQYRNAKLLKIKGDLYKIGYLVERNFEKAFINYQEAAKMNNSKAMIEIALLLYNGDKRGGSISEIIDYLEEAIKYGESEAYLLLYKIYSDKNLKEYSKEQAEKYLELINNQKNNNEEGEY